MRRPLAFQAAVATIAAASGLLAVFNHLGWVLPVAGGCAVVAVASESARRFRVPAALGPLVAAALVTCYVTLVYARTAAYADVIPTRASFHVLSASARAGFADVRHLTTPVPTHRGLVFITVVGVAAIALLVDLLAVTADHAGLAGLPLLALFAVCTSVARHGVGWLPFVIATAGYLWLLLADSRDRLTRWGQPLRESGPSNSPSRADPDFVPAPLSMLGRRIGGTAIAIGALLPVLVPSVHGGLPSHGGGNGIGGNGSSNVVTVNPIVTLQAQLNSTTAVPVLRVRSSDTDPGYLRLTSLDEFDGTTFSPSTLTATAKARVKNGINGPAVTGSPVTSTINVTALSVHWLPLPVQVETVKVKGDWRYDSPSNTVFSSRANTQHLTYTVTSIHPQLSAASLRLAGSAPPSFANYLQLPQSLPSDVRTLASAITAKARSPFDKAVAIQNFLTSKPFVYDTTVHLGDSSQALEEFLLVTHRGFCQQYAAAMAVLARIENIPSRVAVGFTRGDLQPDGSWLVTTHDAHAWPELYFAGIGWVGFEPTPRGDGQAVRPAFTVPDTTTPGAAGAGTAPDTLPTTAPSSAASRAAQLERLNEQNGGGTTKHHNGTDFVPWLVLTLVVGLVATPSMARIVARERRWRRASSPATRAHAAWAELRAVALDSGAGWAEGLSPRAAARVLRAEADGLDAASLESVLRLVRAEERARYAADPQSADSTGLRDEVACVRSALLAGATPGQRFLARVFPRSTLGAVRRGVSGIADLFDALDGIGARLGSVARRRYRLS